MLHTRADTPFCSQVKSAFEFVVQGDNKGEGEGGEIDLGVAHVCAL